MGPHTLSVISAAGVDQVSLSILQGIPGTAGADGFNSLIDLDSTVGANCTNGGVRIRSGLDLDRSGVLDTGEVTDTAYVCNA